MLEIVIYKKDLGKITQQDTDFLKKSSNLYD